MKCWILIITKVKSSSTRLNADICFVTKVVLRFASVKPQIQHNCMLDRLTAMLSTLEWSDIRKSIFETIIHSNIKNIWKIITDNEHYSWRSDISEIKIIEPHHKFIEVSKNGIQTVFTITAIKPYSLYEFDMENKYFREYWIGHFHELSEKETKILFTEIAASGLILTEIEEGNTVPKASEPRKIKLPDDKSFINMLIFDMDSYSEKYSSKCVRKNITHPKWVNTLAEKK